MDNYDFLNNTDPAVIDDLYNQYKRDPKSVDESWQKFFGGFDFAVNKYQAKKSDGIETSDEFKVINLINDYRRRGHLFTQTNPVRKRRTYSPTLDIENYNLQKKDLDRVFQAGREVGIGPAKLKDIIAMLHQTYCKSIGVEYVFIRDLKIVNWLGNRFESTRNTPNYTQEEKKYTLKKLLRAVFFESFLQKKFPGQKRFSLEGAESLIPALEAIMERGSELGVKEFIIGMPHRGRLNILSNILRKPYVEIFYEFKGVEYDDETLLGDVKYHLGFTVERETTTGKKVKFTLAPNPSHLEAVDPVVEGITRAKIDNLYDGDANKIAPILIHGDASIAGQGVVYEVVQMQDLRGYKTGGTIHLVVNNQLGFTTDYLDARSSTYCTDVAKTTLSPVFHVNGDDPEALIFSVQAAVEFRNKFNKDVFIDLLCYRRYGHNEGDEPRFTQPILYKTIAKHPNAYEIYKHQLIEEGVVTEEECTRNEKAYLQKLEDNLTEAKKDRKTTISNFLGDAWEGVRKAKKHDFDVSYNTGISKQELLDITDKLTFLPKGIDFFRKTIRLQENRRELVQDKGVLDWAMAELLAYGSLVKEGFPVRISGQDVERGTFSHRHAVLSIEDVVEKYTPLQHISKDQAPFMIYNSPLSEYAVLGFEYGYSLATPNGLTIWEAQFGDFANGAQIIFDQFLSSAEDKWNVMSPLVVLLPHGYEGQGPEHSSARLERFLILAAENNMQIANCSTPANFFHILRRQLLREFRKPLIMITPKSLLRHPECLSTIAEFTAGKFEEVIDDPNADPEKVNKLVFCSGKLYYDLVEERRKIKNDTVAIARIEQFHPLPLRQILAIKKKYKNAKTYIWAQEEPANMGAWDYIHRNLVTEFKIRVISRPPSGSTATGSPKFHAIQQQKILDKVFSECECPYIDEECKMACIGNKWKSFEKELSKLNVDTVDSKYHSGLKPL